MFKIIFFVEDPGAANYIINLPSKINKNIKCDIYASGVAKKYLEKNRQHYINYDDKLVKGKFFKNLNADLIIVGTSENNKSASFDFIEHARSNNISCGAIIDAPTSIEYRFKGQSNEPYAYIPDFILSSDTLVKEHFDELGIEGLKVNLITNPRHTFVKKYVELNSNTDIIAKRKEIFGSKSKNKSIIIFLSELSDGLNKNEFIKNSDYTLVGFGGSIYRTEIVFEELLKSLSDKRDEIYLVVRLHPKEKKSSYKKYKSHIDNFSITEDPLELIYYSDLVVGMTTSLLSEAKIMGKECLSIIPRNIEIKWLSSIVQKSMPCATNENEINKYLDNYFNTQKIDGTSSKIDFNEQSLCEFLEELNIV